MVVFGALADFAIVIFIVLVFAKYLGIKARKLPMIASAGFLALLAAGSTLLAGIDVVGVVEGVSTTFSVLAWIALLIGTVLVALELCRSAG